jgi:large subunit ribosomal protein L33
MIKTVDILLKYIYNSYSTFERGAIFLEVVCLMRTKITMACTECKQRNYDDMKNKKNTPDRLELKKYCRFCKKHTVHKETK